jgi:glycosyltransferase involved in cell wall biosynthesis
MNLAESLRALGHEVVLWSPEPLPEGTRWYLRWIAQRRKLEALLEGAEPFDVIDVPPVSISRRLGRYGAVVARSVQPDPSYFWFDIREGLRRRPLSPRNVAHALHALVLTGAIVLGWHRARLVATLGSAESRWIRRRVPWLGPRLRHYFNAPSPEEQARLAGVRRARRPPQGPGLRFLWIGRWAAHKGTGRLIRFLRSRLARCPHDTFTLAGCGPGVDRDLRDRGLDLDRIRVIPSFPRPELPALLAGHDVGLFTSEAEGWGLCVNEMLESGLPVYATPAGAAMDLAPLAPGQLEPFPPPDDLAPGSLGGPGDLSRYHEQVTWPRIAARYEAEVLQDPRLAIRRTLAAPPDGDERTSTVE